MLASAEFIAGLPVKGFRLAALVFRALARFLTLDGHWRRLASEIIVLFVATWLPH